MKNIKTFVAVIAVFVLAFCFFCTTAQAASTTKVIVEGKNITFTDAKPFIDQNGRTQVPMRALGEALGCKVDYYYDSYLEEYVIDLSKTGKNNMKWSLLIPLYEYSNTIFVCLDDDLWWDYVSMDTEVVMKNNRSYLPARFVAEQLGYNIYYDASNNAVVITKNNNAYINLPAYQNFDLSYFDNLWLYYEEIGDCAHRSGNFHLIKITNNYLKYTIDDTGVITENVKGINREKGKIYFTDDYYYGGLGSGGALLLFNDNGYIAPVLVTPKGHFDPNIALFTE